MEIILKSQEDILKVQKELLKLAPQLDGKKKFICEINQERQKRRVNANDYCWQLCDKIAEQIGSTKEEVYREAIKEVGVFKDWELKPHDIEHFKKAWELHGIGWFCEMADLNTVRAYFGSRNYNTKQMSRLIDYIVQEAQNLDIETRTPQELAELKSLWRNNER